MSAASTDDVNEQRSAIPAAIAVFHMVSPVSSFDIAPGWPLGALIEH